MIKENNILLKSIPLILSILLPSINYFNTNLKETNGDALIRWAFLSFILLIIWYLNVYISKLSIGYIFIINLVFVGFLSFILIQLNLQAINTIFFPRVMLPVILFVAIQQSFKAIEDRKALIMENLSIKSETYKAELDNLRNQISPHFLFNSLTTLQTLIRQNPIKAEDYLLRLSDFYRRSLLSTNANKIMLSEELAYINSYIFLLESRFEKSLKISIKALKTSSHYSLPVFALQSLVENCIKHNSFSDEKPLTVKIYQQDENTITVTNNRQPKLQKETTTQTGLSNLKKRYELLGFKQGLTISTDEKHFSVTIKLL